jgi:hypothetical protein
MNPVRPLVSYGVKIEFPPDQRPFRANTPLETFSNGVNEPPRWKVEDFLTGFTLSDFLHEIGHFDG